MPDEDTSASDVKEKTLSIRESDATGIIANPPPDGGYGWVCLFAYFCGSAFTWGVVAVSIADQQQGKTS